MFAIYNLKIIVWLVGDDDHLGLEGYFQIDDLKIPLSGVWFKTTPINVSYEWDDRGSRVTYQHEESFLKRLKKEVGLDRPVVITSDRPRILFYIAGGNKAAFQAGNKGIVVWLDQDAHK